MNRYATFERFELEMTLEQALGASHIGPCDEDVAALVAHPAIARQLAMIPEKAIREELRGYGAWDDAELADIQQNAHRLVWCAACNIREEEHERTRA